MGFIPTAFDCWQHNVDMHGSTSHQPGHHKSYKRWQERQFAEKQITKKEERILAMHGHAASIPPAGRRHAYDKQ